MRETAAGPRVHTLIVSLLLGALGASAPAMAALPCQSAVADPCVLASQATIPVGVYDIRPRSLVVKNKQFTISGGGEFKILATNITFEPGGRFIATGSDGNVTVNLDATGTIDIQSQGTSKSKIDVSGNFGGGSIVLHATGTVSVNGTLIANATNLLGFGGPVTVRSETGNVSVTGDPSEGIKSFGNAQGGGGSITLDAPLGSISVSTQLVPKGGDCGSCEVNLFAGVDVTTTAQGFVDLRASGIGDGGFLTATSGGAIALQGDILANGSGDEMDGGTGGDIFVSAGTNVTIGGRIELDGASPDGGGGPMEVEANGFIMQSGPLFARSKGFGQGDEISYDALGNVTLTNEIDLNADDFGGDITVFSDALVTVSGYLHSVAPVDPVNKPEGVGGTIDIEACQINVTAAGQLRCEGFGGNPAGAVLLSASTGLTVAGRLTATTVNELDWRTAAPILTGSVIVPPETVTQVPNLPCCGVSCATTTTTSTSTSSTTSPIPTTSSTSTTRPSTTTTSSSTSTSTSSTSTSSTTTTSTSTSSTTSTSTTSTTLVLGCTTAPLSGCQAAGKTLVLVNEKTFGKEKLKVQLDRIIPPVTPPQFGDPVGGTTTYAVCLYDQTDGLVATMRVARAGAQCGTSPCWKVLSGKGIKYSDKLLEADGIQQIVAKGGEAGKGKIVIKGKNDIGRGQMSLPTRVAVPLAGNRRATAQLVSTDAACFSGTATSVSTADGLVFKGTAP